MNFPLQWIIWGNVKLLLADKVKYSYGIILDQYEKMISQFTFSSLLQQCTQCYFFAIVACKGKRFVITFMFLGSVWYQFGCICVFYCI